MNFIPYVIPRYGNNIYAVLRTSTYSWISLILFVLWFFMETC